MIDNLYLFNVPLENNSIYDDVTIARGGLQKCWGRDTNDISA